MNKKNNDNILNFGQAEIKARKRDLEFEKEKFKKDHRGIEEEEISGAMETLSKATGKDLVLYTKRSPNSNIRFAQTIQENLQYLYQNNYLTGREKIFLMDIIPYIAFSSNYVVLDIKEKSPVPANISEIGKLIGTERSHISRVINSLTKKGLIFKGESGIEGNNAKSYAIFLNPHIIYAGDKDNVNETLKIMFNKLKIFYERSFK